MVIQLETYSETVWTFQVINLLTESIVQLASSCSWLYLYGAVVIS